jgi:uncharacterized protein (TIGR03083 family)
MPNEGLREEEAMPDVIALIGSEVYQIQDFMAGLSAAEWSRPSACGGWAVGDVFAHITQSAVTWRDTILRAQAGDANPPPGQRLLQPGERGSDTTAQRAIAYHQEVGAKQLLNLFAEGYESLRQVLLELQPEDWDKPCFHRRGILPTRHYVGIRLQELTIHGWDIRSAFDAAATLSEPPLPILVPQAQRWLANTFRPASHLTAPIRYRFDISGPATVQQDVLVTRDEFRIEPVTATLADVTFRCSAGTYLLFVYGRVPLEQALRTGGMEMEGDREQAVLFNTLFQGV